jgi:tripartite-type tricarboxylate transporter receptor subunit TctC
MTLLALAALAGIAPAGAQGKYPDKPIRIIVPYTPGGTADLTARMMADRMSISLKTPVVLEFKPGGNLIIGAQAAATSAPDGYTLFLGSGTSHSINTALRSGLQYDARKDFAPVSNINRSAYLVAVPAESAAKTLGEFIALAKTKPGQLSFGSFGAGNITHLAVEMLAREAGVSLNHIPYKGSAQAELDLVAGRIDLLVTTFTMMPHVNDGKVRVLAVTTKERSPLLPNVPTVAESGFPSYDVDGWFAFFAPAQTPKEVIATLGAAVKEAAADPEVQARYAAFGMIAHPASPEAVTQRINEETAKWEAVVTALGIKDKF